MTTECCVYQDNKLINNYFEDDFEHDSYETISFKSIYVDDLIKWISTFKYEIASINGTVQIKKSRFGGMIFSFSDLSIKYYPKTSGHNYELIYSYCLDNIFEFGMKKSYNDVENYLHQYPNHKSVLDIHKKSNLKGTDGVCWRLCVIDK